MANKYPVLLFQLVSMFIIMISCLHTSHSMHRQATDLKSLLAQQNSFEEQVNAIVTNLATVEAKTKATDNNTEKVLILEKTIVSQRQSVFEASNTIIPPFNMSLAACRSLTDEQKVNILKQVAKTKQQMDSLKTMSSGLQPCDELTMLNSDIERQLVLLKGIEKTLTSSCQNSSILSPTIFQSNLYAKNWIYGNQTLDDVIQQYTQRSLEYPNVTNCPISHPYFDGKACIVCTAPKNVFNLLTQKCTQCPKDTSVNNDQRVCEKMAHYTDFTKVDNYAMEGAVALPAVNKSLTACPEQTPYYNSTSCVACKQPSYWSVSAFSCNNCSKKLVFDGNTKQCVQPKTGLTVLQNTRWVSKDGDLTRVLKQRADFLARNPKAASCPTQTPYFDGNICISCPNQFNIDTNQCTSAPKYQAYDSNTHSYVPVMSNVETNSQAKNYINAKPLKDDPKINNCPAKTPFYDGVSCIACQQPFTLFDVASKTCVTCDATQQYNPDTKQCQPRPVVYVSGNNDNLLATKTTSIDNYFTTVKKQAANAPANAIVKPCPNPTDYSNMTDCFSCQSEEYFNVETYKCVTCNGTVDPATNICVPLTTLVTNLTAPNLLLTGDSTLQNYVDLEAKIAQPKQVCPANLPYTPNGKSCIACKANTPYFDLALKTCVDCKANEAYLSSTRKCVSAQTVTNTNNLTNYIESDTSTLASLKTEISKINGPVAPCPVETPYYDGKNCMNCPTATPYFNLETKTCVNCPKGTVYSPTARKCAVYVTNTTNLQNYIESKNYTLPNVKTQIAESKTPTQPCPPVTPYFSVSECINCPTATPYFNLQTKTCVACPKGTVYSQTVRKCALYVTNTTNLSNYFQSGDYTLAKLKAQIAASTVPTQPCPAAIPYFNNQQCISCPQNKIFDLKDKTCKECPGSTQYNPETTNCVQYYPDLSNKNWVVSSPTNAEKVVVMAKTLKEKTPSKICPAKTPFYKKSTASCVSCPADQYFNYDTDTCVPCATPNSIDPNTQMCGLKVSGTHQTSLSSSNLALAGISMGQYQDIYDNNKAKYPNIKDCPAQTPYFDGYACISCPPEAPYFNMRYDVCEGCTAPAAYNDKIKDCVNNGEPVTTAPNIAKMYSSIF